MRIKGDEVAECLHVEDEGGLATRLQGVEAGIEESCDQPAQLTEEITATIAEERSGQLRQGEHILAVWHRREHVILQPLAVGEHALLVTVLTS